MNKKWFLFINFYSLWKKWKKLLLNKSDLYDVNDCFTLVFSKNLVNFLKSNPFHPGNSFMLDTILFAAYHLICYFKIFLKIKKEYFRLFRFDYLLAVNLPLHWLFIFNYRYIFGGMIGMAQVAINLILKRRCDFISGKSKPVF